MNVLGHEDESPQREVVGFPRFVNALGEPFAGSLRRQELEPAEAAERQLMGVSGCVYYRTTLLSILPVHVRAPRTLRLSLSQVGLRVEWPGRSLRRPGAVPSRGVEDSA